MAVFGIVAPMNHFVSGIASKIFQNKQKVSILLRPACATAKVQLIQASDKKMSVLNEMISEIKFIKFMATEDRWMKRALDARATELKYIRQSQ